MRADASTSSIRQTEWSGKSLETNAKGILTANDRSRQNHRIFVHSHGRAKLFLGACALVILVLTSLFLPHESHLRPLSDPKELKSHGLSQEIYAPRPVAPVTFFQGIISANYPGLSFDERLLSKESLTPYYPRPNHIGLSMATYARVNHCTLQLEVEGQKSEIVPCDAMMDNATQIFKFPHPVSVGTHTFKLLWNGSEQDKVALYSFEKNGTLWASLEGQNARLSMAKVFWRWLIHQPLRAGLYICILALSLASLIFVPRHHLLITFTCLYLGLALIWKPYSGHDETAHIDMFHAALTDEQSEPRTLFFNNVYRDMIAADFYRLHQVGPPTPDTCPHSVLLHCGPSEGPLTLYQFYAKFLKKIFPHSVLHHPQSLRMMILGIHFLYLTALVTLVFALGRYEALQITLVQLIFYGALIAIFPAVTNDVPIMLTSILLAAAFQYVWSTPVSLRAKLFTFVSLTGLLYVMYPIDPGIFSVFALTPLLPLFFIPHDTQKEVFDGPLGRRNYYASIFVTLFAVTFVVICVAIFRHILVAKPALIDFLVNHVNTKFGYLTNIVKFNDLQETLHLMFIYGKSVLGSFVWGHSYYHDAVYAGGLLFLGALFVVGFSRMVLTFRKVYQRIFAMFLLTLSLSGLVISIMAAFLGNVHDHVIARDSFLKSRFTSLGLTVLWIFIGVGIYCVQENPKLKKATMIGASLWGVMLLAYYLPRFFLMDIY